jgi:YD repeat-containing protein
MLRVLFAAAAAAGFCLPTAGEPLAQDEGPVQVQYGYDAAGRMVRMGDGTGRFVEFTYDAAGNLLSRTAARRMWQVGVKKPAKGAWVLAFDGDGTVTGHGADDRNGFVLIEGELEERDGALIGTLQLLEEDGETVIDTFEIAKSSIKSDKSGLPGKLTLKGRGQSGPLAASGARPSGALAGFHGVYANAKNVLKAGTTKANPGTVAFVSEGARGSTSTVVGELGGTLVRDPKGKAYGVITWDGDDYVVLAKLKDGAKAVSMKTGKGAPVKLKIKVKR